MHNGDALLLGAATTVILFLAYDVCYAVERTRAALIGRVPAQIDTVRVALTEEIPLLRRCASAFQAVRDHIPGKCLSVPVVLASLICTTLSTATSVPALASSMVTEDHFATLRYIDTTGLLTLNVLVVGTT